MHDTLRKFGYPAGLVFETRFWAVLVRPAQPTIGSLVLVLKRDVTSFAALTTDEALDVPAVAARIEACLAALVGFERINYLMLMMVDPHVHFHVIPRHAGERSWRGITLVDAGWPGVPLLSPALDLTAEQVAQLRLDLVAAGKGTIPAA